MTTTAPRNHEVERAVVHYSLTKMQMHNSNPLGQKVTLYAFDTHGNPIEMEERLPKALKAKMIDVLAHAHANCPICTPQSS